ncbi:hypothetical protein Vi05172_g10349 [Venturia inaequalis]|nr:hypothetical protein Vi05172_g10349 [Venturia inaequalis]
MSAIPASAAPTAPQASGNAPRRPRNRQRNRGGRANAENGAPVAAPQLLPASVTPSVENSNHISNGAPTRGGRGGRRGGRGRGGDQPGAARSQPARTVPGGRRFGGQLTTGDDEISSQSDAQQLHAGASEFVPGQPVLISKGPKPRAPPQPRKRRMSKSTAPDIGTRIHEDVDNGNYECAKAQLWLALRPRTGPCRHRDNGAVRAAIYQRTICHRHFLVGVKRKQNQDRYLVFHHSVAVRLALVATCCQRSVLIHAQTYATLDPASLALRWALNRVAFVVVNLSHVAVSIRITRMAGHVVKSAESSCLVGNTSAIDLVTRAYAEPVTSLSRLVATVDR